MEKNNQEFDYRKARAILMQLASVINAVPNYHNFHLEVQTFEDQANSDSSCIYVTLDDTMNLSGNIIDGVNCISLLKAGLFSNGISIIQFDMDIAGSQIYDVFKGNNECREKLNAAIYTSDFTLPKIRDKHYNDYVKALDDFIGIIAAAFEAKFVATV